MKPCPDCSGRQWTIVQPRIAQRCHCFQPATLADRELSAIGIPPHFHDADLSSYSPRNATQQNAKDVIAHLSVFYQEENGNVSPAGAVIVGPAGCGKTHLAVALLKAYLSNGFSALFLSYLSFLQNLEADVSSEFARTADPFALPSVREAMDVDVLLLDHVAVSNLPENLADTLPALLRFRYNQLKTTILTSRLPLESAGGKESLCLELRYASLSRLLETCAVLELKG